MTRYRADAVLLNDIATELDRLRGHVRGVDLLAEDVAEDGEGHALRLACEGMDRRLDRLDALLLELGERLLPADLAILSQSQGVSSAWALALSALASGSSCLR